MKLKQVKLNIDLINQTLFTLLLQKQALMKQKIEENLNVLIDAIKKAKPAAAKGQYFRSVTLTSHNVSWSKTFCCKILINVV